MDWWHNWQSLTKEELNENIHKEYRVLKLMFCVCGNDPHNIHKIIKNARKEWVKRDPMGILWTLIADEIEEYLISI